MTATRPLRIDSFMINDEIEMLRCRLTELAPVVDYFVAVEADVDHQDHRKPYYISENMDQLDEWADQLIVVQASGLPTRAEKPDPWAREHAQREWVWDGLGKIGVDTEDIVLHGDLDEIPTRLWARNVRPYGATMYGCKQTLYSMAVDWKHPDPWFGTVAARVGAVRSFGAMRDTRNFVQPIPSGWHLSWLGGTDAALRKLGSFCHPEVASRIHKGLTGGCNSFLDEGIHADLKQMVPVDVDHSWPEYVYKRQCPESWFRPRG